MFIAKYLWKGEERLCSLQSTYASERIGYVHCNVLMEVRGSDMFIAMYLWK